MRSPLSRIAVLLLIVYAGCRPLLPLAATDVTRAAVRSQNADALSPPRATAKPPGLPTTPFTTPHPTRTLRRHSAISAASKLCKPPTHPSPIAFCRRSPSSKSFASTTPSPSMALCQASLTRANAASRPTWSESSPNSGASSCAAAASSSASAAASSSLLSSGFQVPMLI